MWMAGCWKDRREQGQRRAQEQRFPKLTNIMHPSGCTPPLDDNGEAAQLTQVSNAARDDWTQVVKKQHAAPLRQPSHRRTHMAIGASLDNQPLLGFGLAASHGASYSGR
jgi:hypothetical protein